MLDKKTILKDIPYHKERLALKGFDLDEKEFLYLENERKELQVELEGFQNKKNQFVLKTKQAFIEKRTNEEINEIKKEIDYLNKMIKNRKDVLDGNEEALYEILIKMPNMPHEHCPIGNGEEDNLFVAKKGVVPNFNFQVKDHIDLAEVNENGLNFEKGVALAQSRFTVMTGKLARLHRALAQFMLDLHTDQHGYKEVNVPVIVNKKALIGTGQLPKFKEDLFKIDGKEMSLIPTAEVPLTNLVADELLSYKDLPIKMTAHSLCFRSEAGSAGRDVRGILRQHQFEKVELVQIVEPEKSMETLDEILGDACKVLDLLELPYQVVELCTGDLGFGAMKTFDIEVWIPSQNTYREISSCSNMGDFQARRMNARYKDENGKKKPVHTLNGSGLAVGRTLLALMENKQMEDGRIAIPLALRPYLGNKEIL